MGISSLFRFSKGVVRINSLEIACLTLALFAAVAPADDTPSRGNPESPRGFNSKEPPITLRVTTPRTRFTQLEPVAITIEMSAKEGQRYQFQTNSDNYLIYEIVVTQRISRRNVPIPQTRDYQLAHMMFNNRSRIAVMPGKTFRTTIYANLVYDMTFPGDYTITARYVYGHNPIKKIEQGETAKGYQRTLPNVNSEPITITVVPLPLP